MKTLAFLLSVPLLVGAATSVADPGSDRGRRHGPPPEAIEACAELSEGDACSFAGRRGDTLEGSCVVDDRGGSELACLPANAPEPRDRERREED